LFQPYVLNCFNCASSLRRSSTILEGPGLAGRDAVYVGVPRPIWIPLSLILPITFEPFDLLRRQMVGEPFPGD
jgi:hypothetical protein